MKGESDSNWQTRASCRENHEPFYGPDREGKEHKRIREDRAKAICNSCEVTIQCLEQAIDTGERFGIWGGLNEKERTRLQRSKISSLWISPKK